MKFPHFSYASFLSGAMALAFACGATPSFAQVNAELIVEVFYMKNEIFLLILRE